MNWRAIKSAIDNRNPAQLAEALLPRFRGDNLDAELVAALGEFSVLDLKHAHAWSEDWLSENDGRGSSHVAMSRLYQISRRVLREIGSATGASP